MILAPTMDLNIPFWLIFYGILITGIIILKRREPWQIVFILPLIIVLSFIALIIYDLLRNGIGVITFEFLFSNQGDKATEGGIFPAIFGTMMVTFITFLVSVPIGISTAIYLNEYTKGNMLITMIRVAIRNLAGVPSIVYGLFGLFIFAEALHFGRSVLASGLTLGLLTLPWIITASEEALKTVPKSYREGSLALGSTKWQAIYRNVLPTAMPGIITGIILGISRAAGETAPILVTGAAFSMPFHSVLDEFSKMPGRLFDEFMALPYHLFTLATQHEGLGEVRPIAYGTAITLLGLVVLLNIFAVLFRSYMRRKHRGVL